MFREILDETGQDYRYIYHFSRKEGEKIIIKISRGSIVNNSIQEYKYCINETDNLRKGCVFMASQR